MFASSDETAPRKEAGGPSGERCVPVSPFSAAGRPTPWPPRKTPERAQLNVSNGFLGRVRRVFAPSDSTGRPIRWVSRLASKGTEVFRLLRLPLVAALVAAAAL